MVDWLVTLFQDPTVSSLLTAVAVEGGKAIYQKLLRAEQNTPEWQLFDSLDRAFFQTETDLSRKHDTEAIRETFFSELFDFSSAFSIDTLKQVFQDALGRPATDHELNVWVSNVVKQIALPEHEVLFRYLQTLHILPNELTQQPQKPSPFLTPGASVWDDQNILARDKFINELCSDFSQHPRRIQLVGMGGIGKTEILNKLYAKLVAKPAKCGFDFVGLVHFSGSIETDLGQQIEPPKGYLGMQGAEAALRYLRDVCTEHCVLLLIDDIRAQQPLPKAKDNPLQYLTTLGASVLLASRVPFPQFDKRDVAVLPTDKCIEIFEKQFGKTISGEDERKLLVEIIKGRAGQNTLVVNRLGGMAKDSGWSIKELFDHLETQQFSIPKGAADDETLQIEIRKLYTLDKDFTPAEISILEAFSIFPAIPLALDLCKEWLSKDAGVEPEECARVLAGLAKKTWLVRHKTEGSDIPMYYMHQVVSAAVKGQRTINSSVHIGLVDACTKALKRNTKNFTFALNVQIIPFAIDIFGGINENNVQALSLSDGIGRFYEESAVYSIALQWRYKTVFISERMFGVENRDTATAYHNLANTYMQQGDYKNALKWYSIAQNIRERIWGTNHPDTAATYCGMASIYHTLGEYQKAIEWYIKAREIIEKTLGETSPDAARVYNDLALVYCAEGDYPNALELNFKALEIRENVLGKDHPDTSTVYNNIALVYFEQKEYDKALEWFFKALEICVKVLVKEHPYNAITYNNIAAVYYRQGDFSKALEWNLRALSLREKILGKVHPDTAESYNNIASVYSALGDDKNALEWYSKALEIDEKILGYEHPNTAATCENIAWIYIKQEYYQAALEWLQKAYSIYIDTLGVDHPYSKATLRSIEFVTAKLVSTDPSK